MVFVSLVPEEPLRANKHKEEENFQNGNDSGNCNVHINTSHVSFKLCISPIQQ